MRGIVRGGLVALLLAAAACSHGQADIATLTSNSDQVIWDAGQKALQKHEWEAARQHFKRIIDAFPQSRYAPGARLALGDSYVQEGGTANDIFNLTLCNASTARSGASIVGRATGTSPARSRACT